MLERAAPLHDVGKVGMPDTILLKRGPLTPGELEIIRTHATMGARILSGSRVPLLRMAEEIALDASRALGRRGLSRRPHGAPGSPPPAASSRWPTRSTR